MTSECRACVFSELAVMVDAPVRECRRFPPPQFVIGDEIVRCFVQVEDHDWCGEFQPVGEGQ